VSTLDFDAYEVLSFDCYGTLIDWESGILNGLRPVLAAHGARPPDEELLVHYAECEAALEAGEYRPYREVLGLALRGVGAAYGVLPTAEEVERFSGSVEDWPAFADSAQALARLRQRFKLAVITNCDDDLFAASNRRLGVDFDWIVTAQQARSYKPSARNFELAFVKIGVPRERILHVAQSLFHDHAPAKKLDLATVWINRRHDKAGFGATPPAEATPDVAVPDMATFADRATA
jgi:2-haloacid dehalogenase